MKRIILTTLILTLLISPACFAGDALSGIPSYVKNPDELARWLAQDFRYRYSIPNIPQTPEETLKLKGGDCDDLAALASAVLEDMGISSSVVAISFKDPNDGHAICVWKDADGAYSFISNQQIFHTTKTTVDESVKTVFPNAVKVLADCDRRAQSRYFKM